MLDRQIETELNILRNEFPIIAILGPRQSGKTTLSKKVFSNYEYVSFEDYDVREFAENDPRGFLGRYSENIIFDEIQRSPEIISYLQTHVDQHRGNGKIIITGSHNFLLMEQISQSLAGRTGQELNLSSLGEECGISHNTVLEWISVLEASFIVYRLKPFHKNYNKRLVKRPKVYFTDTGLVCSLLGIRNKEELDYHFLKGSIFETFIVSEILKADYNTGERFEMYYWRDNHKKEIDLIIDAGRKQLGIEIKSSGTVSEKYFDGLKYWKGLTETDSENLYLIYGGTENMKRNGMNVIS
jgi:predicted AAA+ superfamily ATPase